MFVSVLLREVRVFFMHMPVPSQSVRKVMYFIYQLSNITKWVECFWISQISGRNIFSTTVYCMWHTGKAIWTGNSNSVLSFPSLDSPSKGPGKRGHIVADTLSPTQMFPRLPARATFVADTNFVSGTQKMFLVLFRNILCPQQMFPSLRSPRNIMSNNVSSFARALKGEKSCWSVQ